MVQLIGHLTNSVPCQVLSLHKALQGCVTYTARSDLSEVHFQSFQSLSLPKLEQIHRSLPQSPRSPVFLSCFFFLFHTIRRFFLLSSQNQLSVSSRAPLLHGPYLSVKRRDFLGSPSGKSETSAAASFPAPCYYGSIT